MNRVTLLITIALVAACTQATPAPASVSPQAPRSSASHITRIQIDKVESPTFEGRSFGNVGTYEKLIGRALGEIDPKDAHDKVITDIDLAARNARGMVEYSMDIFILKPVDLSNGNHRLLPHVNNRGNLGFLSLNDGGGGNPPTKAADAGNGFLMRLGYTVVSAGWDVGAAPGDGRLTMTAPVAKNTDGSSIVGPAMEELVIDNSTTMTGTLSYPAASLDKTKAELTVRVLTTDNPTAIPSSGWEYVNASTIRLLPDGTPFQNGRLYEFTFPFGNSVITDPVTKRTDGWLRVCLATNTCPKIFEVNSENEYWAKAGSNLTTDANGNDVPDAPNVRNYLMSSLPHGAGTGPGICQQPRNPLVASPVLRALLVALDRWVTGGEPPASRVPPGADGTLVAAQPQAGVGFPSSSRGTHNGV